MNDTILGGLIAIVSFLGAKLSDYLFMTRAHDLALKKEYFLKKINAFEKATTYYTISHTSITAISFIFNLLNNEDADLPKPVIDTMLKKVADNLERVQQSTQDSALAIGLYTDFQFTEQNEVFFSRYLDVTGQIGLKTQVMELINGKVANTPEEEGRDEELSDKILGEMLALVSELVGISTNLKTLYTGVTQHLRDQMKKFDHQ